MIQPEIWLDQLAATLDDLEVTPRGVCHLGAHDGREVPHYRRLGFHPIILVEPLPDRAAQLRRLFPTCVVVEAAIGPERGPVTFYRTPHDEASSARRPLLWPAEVLTVPGLPLEALDLGRRGVNVLVVDVQGAEVDALASGPLDPFEVLVVETPEPVRYEGGANRETVDTFLEAAGFVVSHRHPHRVGDLFDTVYRRRA